MAHPVPTLEELTREVSAFAPRKAPGLGRAAAVLIPLLPRPAGLALLFTERSAELKSHAGQISFPGGSIDPEDAGPVEAALREAEEEVGLSREDAHIVGLLDDCPTFVTGFVITPVVAVLTARPQGTQSYPWRPAPAEIARLHELPFAAFCDPANLRVEERESAGVRYELFWYTVEDVVVWGATARIVHQLVELAAGRGAGRPPGDWRPGTRDPGGTP